MTRKHTLTAAAVFLVAAAVAIAVGTNVTKSAGRKNALPDGEWQGTGQGRNGPISLAITVQNGRITGGHVISEDETDFAKPVAQAVIDQAVKRNSVTGLDAVSGATMTSKGTMEALVAAVALARGELPATTGTVAQDSSCDIVVIGAGGAGLSAATEAASHGASVIVVEKMGIAGGNTNYATGGLNASETSVQKKLGIEDTNEQYYADTMKGGYNLNDPALVRKMVEESAATVDWLMSLGADLSDVGKMAGSTNKRTHRPQGGAAIGAHLVPVLVKATENASAEIRYNSKVTDIIEENGKAAGVKVSSSNGDYVIKAKAVIIATGGFGANPDMIVTYQPSLKGFGTTNHRGATGDAFAWIAKFDGALTQMEQIQTHPTVVPGNGLMITEAVRGNGAIMVNRGGRRFNNEMATRDVMSNAILEQEGKTAYLVFDQGIRESLKAIEGYAKQGLLTEGASLAELASKLGMPSGALEETVANYNAYQSSGTDPDFSRPAGDMPRGLVKAPYYAVEVGPAVHHTMGGIKINTNAEVLTKEGNAIPGLFAAGEVTGGIHGSNRLGGNAVADICVYGKIAADSALAYIGK